MKQIELIEKRRKREKHFLREDGLCIAYLYNDNIHYLKDGKYQEIDNTIIKRDGKLFNRANDYKVEFDENANNELMCVTKNKHFIRFNLKDNKNIVAKQQKGNSKNSGKIKYGNIFNNIDLEYEIKPTKIKENIILRSIDSYKSPIEFDIDTDACLELLENGCIKVVFSDDSFLIEAPFMADSNGNTCSDAFYQLKKNNDNYILSLYLDLEWLKAEEREYPVYIDPTIIVDQDNCVQDTYIFPGDTNIDRNSQDILKVGVERTNNVDKINRALIRFELPTIGTGSSVVSASINLFKYPGLNDWDFYDYNQQCLTIHRITNDWNEINANWSTMNDKFDSRIINWLYGGRSINGYDLFSEGYDITELVKKWYSGTDNFGLMIKDISETYQNSLVPAFFSKNNAIIGNVSPKPYLEIVYKSFNGLENYMEYSSSEFSGGIHHLNYLNGNLIGEYNIIETINSKFPALIKMFYNTNDVVLNKNYGYGVGYKLNFNQYIREVLDNNTVSYIEWDDEDGTTHYLSHNREYYDGDGEIHEEYDNNKFYDESGGKKIAYKSGQDYIIEDSSNNKMYFSTYNSGWRLYRICDNQGKQLNISYNNSGFINQVTDGDNNIINIYYENNQIRFVYNNEEVSLYYSNNRISNITDRFGSIQLTYDSNGCISSLVDKAGLKITYEYYSKSPYKVKSITEYGLNNELGEKADVYYGYNLTTIKDNKDRVSTYVFKYDGTLASISDLKENQVVDDAYGMNMLYGDFGQDKNKLLKKQNSLKWVNNLIMDSSFENNNIGFVSGSNISSISINNTDSRTGKKCLSISNDGGSDILTKTISVKKGKYYTFSAYFKASNTAQLFLSTSNTDGETTIIYPSDEYNRYSATIYFPSDNNGDYGNLYININVYESNLLLIDDMQLEEGKVANYYNLINNSDFSNGMTGWTVSGYDPVNDTTISNIGSVVNLGNNKNALCISMNPKYYTSFSYELPISGKRGDIYNLSFWFKNTGINCFSLDGMGEKSNNVIIDFDYVENQNGHQAYASDLLNPNETEWQFFSYTFVAEENYNSISFTGWQSMNANNLYITNIGLYRDIREETIDYATDGYLSKIYNYENQETEFKFDNNKQVIKIMKPEGLSFKYEYDNSDVSRVINAISPMRIINTNVYDNNNPIVNRISCINDDISLESNLYRIRLKGQEKFLGSVGNVAIINNNKCCANIWNVVKDGDYYQIIHSIFPSLFLTIQNNSIVLSNYNNDYSLFEISEKENGSYTLKNKGSNKFITADTNVALSDIDEDTHFYEFYFEKADNKDFIESNLSYSNGGIYINSALDNSLNKTNYLYDVSRGLLLSEVNPNGVTTKYIYNNKDKVIAKKINKRTVNYSYNNNGQINEIVRGNRTYTVTYDNFYKTQCINIGNNTLVSNTYDNRNGNVILITYGNNNSLQNEYDEFDRVKQLTTMDDEYVYEYGKSGQLLKVISNDSVRKYDYNLSNMISEINAYGYKFNYVYDTNNNITKKGITNGFYSHDIANTYNLNGKLVRNVFNSEARYLEGINIDIEYEYDYLGRLKKKKINDEYNVLFEYIDNGHRASKLLKSISNNNDKYNYIYDNLDNITKIYHNNLLTHKFKYNNYNELIVEYDYVNDKKIKYVYDTYGNILEKNILKISNNKLVQRIPYHYGNPLWKDQITDYNGLTITYDGIGNITSLGNKNYSWINGSQLHSFSCNNIVHSYKYNDEGIRTQKDDTLYTLEGNKIIAESCSSYDIFYLYNDIDNLIGFVYNECGELETYYYLKNAQMDIVGIMDENYNIVAKYDYDAWGNILHIQDNNGNDLSNNSSHIANINPFRYRSYYYDRESDLYYLGRRYYSPELGRFISCDLQLSDDANGNNLYVYCGNNPTSRVDIDGEFWWTVAKFVIGAACGVIGNGISNLAQGKNFFDGGGKAFVSGGISGLAFGYGFGATLGIHAAANIAGEATDYIPIGNSYKRLKSENIKNSLITAGFNTILDTIISPSSRDIRGAKPSKFISAFTTKHATNMINESKSDIVVDAARNIITDVIDVKAPIQEFVCKGPELPSVILGVATQVSNFAYNLRKTVESQLYVCPLKK